MKESRNFDIDIQSLDIKDFLYKILGYWKLFLFSLLLALFIAKVINLTSKRVFRLDALITVKDEQNPLFSSGTNIAFNWGGPSDMVETVITILQSRSHNEKVVKELDLYIDYLAEGKFNKIDVFGKTPFVIFIDTLRNQLINHNIQLDFLENDQVRIGLEFEDERVSLLNYHSNSRKGIPL